MSRGSKSNAGLVVGLASVGVVLLAAMGYVAVTASNGAYGDDTTYDVRTVGWHIAKGDDDGATAAAYPSENGKVVVRVGKSAVVGYKIGTGEKDWQVTLPNSMRTCAATNFAPDGIAAVVMGNSGECTDVLAVDVNKGKQVWRAQLRNDADQPSKSASVTTAKGRVFVSTQSGIARYDAKKGPSATGDAAPGFAKAPRGCEFGGSARANDKAVLAILQCTIPPKTLFDQPKVTGYLTGFSATSMKGILRAELASGPGIKDRLEVATAAPVVVRDIDKDKSGELRFFDSKGKETATLPADQQGTGTLDMSRRPGLGVETDGNHEFVFQQVEKTMVIPVRASGEQRAKAVGVDLEKGTVSWTKTVGRANGGELAIAAVDDDPKQAAAVDASGGDPRLVTIDGKKGTVEQGDKLPKSAAPADTDVYLSLGPALVRVRTGQTDSELMSAYGR